MTPAYRKGAPHWWQTLSDADVAFVVAHIVVGIWMRRLLPVIGISALCGVVGVRRVVTFVAVLAGAFGMLMSSSAWRAVVPDHLGRFEGIACLITDPAPRNGATVAVFEIEGERFEAWARGSPRRRLAGHLVTGNTDRILGYAPDQWAARRHGVDHIHIGDRERVLKE